MTQDNKDPTLNMDIVLSNCGDFQREQTALQALYNERGHILLMSVKFHPEMAGLGIEFSWGKSKLEFRRRINDQIPANLQKNIQNALSTDVLPLSRIRSFARRTRDYRQVYSLYQPNVVDKEGETGYDFVEKMRKKRKTHRNIVDLEVKFLLNC
eukprot:Pompholyxophrys_punicea_v1_NODE_71_length_3757_cov_5.265460.p3 type:complete len:154 gc:universal NODE_71_length_3757_cov_5.265460:2540-3001(+)